jgi:hypothetical protein
MITQVKLETGTLLINSDAELESLSGFAARNNAKRGFLFLSKVLGKHYPSCPNKMQEVHENIARQIKPKLKPGPTIVIGFSETATCLGYGIYAALNQPDSYYQHSTRHRIDRPMLLAFNENHSHATSHYLYYPESIRHQTMLKNAANIVFVDDEYTTGNTLLNIISAFKEKQISPHFIATSILDWTTKSKDSCLPEIVSLVKGSVMFSGNHSKPVSAYVSEMTMPPVHQNLSNAYGRVGCEMLSVDFKSKITRFPGKHERVLVIGTGEFMNIAYLLGLFLKSYTPEVFVQSTTRSPIMLGNDVQSAFMFKDNYGENIDNFLYNVINQSYEHLYVCYETDSLPAEHTLYQQLNAFFPQVTILHF